MFGSKSSTTDIVIIGSGISGLSLAWYCSQKGLKTRIIEKANHFGGAFHSHDFESGGETPFWLELGAHTFYNSYGNLIKILEESSLITQIIPRAKVPFRVLEDGKIKSITSKLNFLELAYSMPKLFFAKKTDCTVEEYYKKIVGVNNYNRLFTHFFSAVPSQKADEFPADMLFKKKPRNKEIIRSYTFKLGAQMVIDKLTVAKGVEATHDDGVTKIKSSNKDFEITTEKGEKVRSKYLAITTPVNIASQLLETYDPEISESLSKIETRRAESQGVIVHKDNVPVAGFAGLVPLERGFFSVVSRDTVPHPKYRGFTFHFEAGRFSLREKMERITKTLGIQEEQILQTIHKVNILPSPKSGHHQLISKIDRKLLGTNLILTGNYFAGMAIEDCVTRTRSEFQRVFE